MRLLPVFILACVPLACSEERPNCESSGAKCSTPPIDSGVTDTGPRLDATNDDAGLDDSGARLDASDAGPLDAVVPDSGAADTGLGSAVVDFPPLRSVTDATRMTIFGRTDVSSGVDNINVSGRAAASNDGFRTFRAEVDLVPGRNRITLQTSGTGFVTPEAFVFEIFRDEVLLLSPRDVALDPGGRLVITDSSLAQLVAIDLSSGLRTLISGATRGSGPSFVEPWGVALDLAGGRALVMDRTAEILCAVDLTTGDRTEISGGASAGPALGDPAGIALDLPNQRALIVDAGLNALVAISLTTGERTILSDDLTGAGPPMDGPRDLVYDPANSRVYVADSGSSAIFIISLPSGDRSVSVGSGPFFIEPRGVELDAAGNRLLVGDSAQHAIYAINLQTGVRTAVADLVTGQGPLVDPRTMALAADGTLYAVDSIQDAILEVDSTSGNRSVIASSENGVGDHFGGSWGVAAHPSDPEMPILVTDTFLESLFGVAPRSGDRTVITGPGGRGPAVDQPYAVAYDPANNRALMSDPVIDALVAVNLMSGERSLVANAVTGTGPSFNGPRGVALLPAGGGALVADSGANALFRVDLATGDRTVIADAATGTGPAFDEPWGVVVLDAATAVVIDSTLTTLLRVELATGNRTELAGAIPLVDPRAIATDGSTLWVADYGAGSVVAVDPVSGARTVVADATRGRGPPMVAPTGIAAHPAGYLVVADEFDVLFAVDPQSGDRVYLSK